MSGKFNRVMKLFNNALQFLILILLFFTIVSIVYSVEELNSRNICFEKDCYHNLIRVLIEYQTIYVALIGLITLYFGFYQINILIQQNNEKKTFDTLNQISHFYIEIQNNVKEFYLTVENEEYNFFDFQFNINDFTDHDLADQKEEWCQAYSNFEKNSSNKNKVTLLLGRIEAFANIILHGNIDFTLFKKLLGQEYIRQIEILYPFISSYRSRKKTTNFYSGITLLYEKLKG